MGLDLSGINLNLGEILSSAGTLAKDIRTAITGETAIDPLKRQELELKATAMETQAEKIKLSVMLAEAQSGDPLTSRARPFFLYVIYILILFSIPMGFLYAFSPTISQNVIIGFGSWLKAIPDSFVQLFGFGYCGYSIARSYDKKVGKEKAN
jgi:hypothetical protein